MQGQSRTHLDEPALTRIRRDELDDSVRPIVRVRRASSPTSRPRHGRRRRSRRRRRRADGQARRQLGIDAVHRRLVGLHAAGEPDGLIGGPPRPAPLVVLPALELSEQGVRRTFAKREQIGERFRTSRLAPLDGGNLGFVLVSVRRMPGPEEVHVRQVPQQVGGRPFRTRGTAHTGVDARQRIGEST